MLEGGSGVEGGGVDGGVTIGVEGWSKAAKLGLIWASRAIEGESLTDLCSVLATAVD